MTSCVVAGRWSLRRDLPSLSYSSYSQRALVSVVNSFLSGGGGGGGGKKEKGEEKKGGKGKNLRDGRGEREKR